MKKIKQKNKKGFNIEFVSIPFQAIKDKSLTCTSLKILGLVNSLNKMKKDFFMGNEYIAYNISSSKGSVSNAISLLVRKNYINRILINNNHTGFGKIRHLKMKHPRVEQAPLESVYKENAEKERMLEATISDEIVW